MGQEAAGRWVAGREVRLLTWTPGEAPQTGGSDRLPSAHSPEEAAPPEAGTLLEAAEVPRWRRRVPVST